MIWIDYMVVQNSLYLCLCNVSHPGNSVYTHTWASSHCFQNIIISILQSVMLCVCVWDQSPSNFCTCSQMFCDMDFFKVDTLVIILPQHLYHCSCRFCDNSSSYLNNAIKSAYTLLVMFSFDMTCRTCSRSLASKFWNPCVRTWTRNIRKQI
jgi:hypothetical protein